HLLLIISMRTQPPLSAVCQRHAWLSHPPEGKLQIARHTAFQPSRPIFQATSRTHKKQNPTASAAGFWGVNPGDDLLSHGLGHTTIGAAAFHFRVRDGIGWFHSAVFTRKTVGAARSNRRISEPRRPRARSNAGSCILSS